MPVVRMALRDVEFTTKPSIVDGKMVIEGEFALGENRFSVSGTMEDWKKIADGLKEEMLRALANPKSLGVDVKGMKEQLRRLRILKQMQEEIGR